MESSGMSNDQLKIFLQSLLENVKKAKDLQEVIKLLEKLICNL